MDGPTLAELAADPDRLDRVPDEELPDVLAALERLRARVWGRLSRPVPQEAAPGDPGGGASAGATDRLMDVEAVADVLDVDERYVYDHADDWPFTRRLSPRKLRFSERGLYRWLERR